MVNLIPDQNLFSQGPGVHAERKTLEYLKALPDDYFLLQEFKMLPSSERRRSGSQEDRPDFVLVGPQLGMMVLEVKDWNIRANTFSFENQYEILKTDLNTHEVTLIDNPWHQMTEYRNALQNLQRQVPGLEKLWVSGFVVYPKLSRAEFENAFSNRNLQNPQSRYLCNMDTTLFQDDLALPPAQLLDRLASFFNKSLKTMNRMSGKPYDQQQVKSVVNLLSPSELRVGGSHNENATQKLALLDSKQWQWACGKDLENKHYLADVAGSGKTNVLLSRAIHWAKAHYDRGGCRILITTYSKALQKELQRIFKEKIVYDPLTSYYEECIFICDVITLMEDIVRHEILEDFQMWKENTIALHSANDYLEEKLPEKCIDILQGQRAKFASYDYLLIDEIQDFSTWFLDVTLSLLKNRNNFFAVGDASQKLFDRDIEWGGMDLVLERVLLESQYHMYRSPQPIARLAWKFLTSDKQFLHSLKESGYKEEIKYKSPFQIKPIFHYCSTEEDLLAKVVADIRSYTENELPEHILCVGQKDGLLPHLYQNLQQASLPVRWATDVPNGKYVLLADYVEAKGLERDYVFILDTDHLANQKDLFASSEERRKLLIRDRIKLFVALTRAMREVRLYYIDPYHKFIQELLQLQRK